MQFAGRVAPDLEQVRDDEKVAVAVLLVAENSLIGESRRAGDDLRGEGFVRPLSG